ncbi:MAG: GDSL-type esterase/lipase family protein [Gemmatimonadales bacterium]
MIRPACRIPSYLLLLLVGWACGRGDLGPDEEPPVLLVTTVTSGTEIDAEGYTLSLNGEPGSSIGANATVTVEALAGGEHRVGLEGLAGNCGIAGENPRVVTAQPGQTVQVSFTVACAATTGIAQVQTTTDGAAPDPDGYSLLVNGVEQQAVGVAATVTLPGLAPGEHVVGLDGVAAHCLLEGENPRPVTVTAGATSAVAFSVSCAASPDVGEQLAAPERLLPNALSLTQIRLFWKDRSSSETGFEILRSTTGRDGTYSLVGTVGQNIVRFTNSRLSAGREYCYQVRARGGNGSATSAGSVPFCVKTLSGAAPAVRVVTFGDSNTDWGLDGTNRQVLAHSYVSESPYSAALVPHTSDQLAGKIETRWRSIRSNAIGVVNHAIAGTTTGGGGFGGPNRRSTGAPQARTRVAGTTRFEGEVLGAKWPWSGGEPVNAKYVDGALARVQAFVPGTNDFVYVSMGTNDPGYRITTQQTVNNLGWMIDRWLAAGRAADHFILTTLAPCASRQCVAIPAINQGIRTLAASRGLVLIDLAGHTSDDDGRTWRSSALHVGDSIHYSEPVRDWLAERVVDAMSSRVP